MVYGGADGAELAEEVVRDGAVGWARGSDGLEIGGEVVEGEEVGGDHSHEEEEIQAHGETHRRDSGFLLRWVF